MVKMPKIYSARFIYMTENLAAASSIVLSNVFRDILPDKAFQLVSAKICMKQENIETTELQLLKNIGDPGGPVPGSPPVANHGVVYELVHVTTGWHNEIMDFAEPIDFDRDDSLSIRMLWGTQGAGENAVFETILRVKVGK